MVLGMRLMIREGFEKNKRFGDFFGVEVAESEVFGKWRKIFPRFLSA
jgi:hypothetical protein